MATRWTVAAIGMGVAKVRKRGKTPLASDAEPCASVFQVAAGKHAGGIVPEGRRRGRTCVEFVAVGGDDQRIFGVLSDRQQ